MNSRVIDCQWHWYPRAVCESLLDRADYPRFRPHGDGYLFEPTPTETWEYPSHYVDLERQLEVMDECGIDAVIASPVVAGDVSALGLSEARELCAMLNEELARAQREHPALIWGLAVLPVQEAATAVEYLDDAIDRLGLVGAILHSNVAGESIARPALWPLYARLEERGVPLFLHPTRTYSGRHVRAFDLESPLGFMFDTTAAAVSLIVGGVLDEFPSLQVVHPHLGAALPVLADRLDVYRRLGRWSTPRPIRDYLPRFYTDTVSESPEALALALDLYGADKLLFASDFPYFPPADGLAFVSDHLAPDQTDEILGGNAIRLFGLDVMAASET